MDLQELLMRSVKQALSATICTNIVYTKAFSSYALDIPYSHDLRNSDYEVFSGV